MGHKQVSAFDAGYSNLLDSVREDKDNLKASLADVKSGKFLPRLKEDLLRLGNSGVDWVERLEKKLEAAKASGKPDEGFIRAFAAEYADFSAKRYEFAVKLEGAKAYSTAVYTGNQNVSDARSSLLKTASMYKEKEIKAAFAGLSGDLKLASMVSLTELFGADLSLSQKTVKNLASIAQAEAIDASVAEQMLWHTYSDIYLKGHPGQFADVLKEALKSVRAESKNTLDAQTVIFKKGKVVLDSTGRPVEEKLLDAGVRTKLGAAYSEVEALLIKASTALKQEDSRQAAKLFKEAAEQIVSVREAANKRIGEAVYEHAGISPSEWKEVVADAAVLGLGVAGSLLKMPVAPLASSAYFAVKGGFYVHLGIVTKNNDLVLVGALMMAPLMLGTAAKGMLAVAEQGGARAGAFATAGYSLVLSERAIGVYFTSSMSYNAIHGAVEGAKYGFTPELVKETVQNAVFAGFGLAVATGRISVVKATLRDALEGVGLTSAGLKDAGVGQGIKKGSGAKVIPIRTEVKSPAEAVEAGREEMRQKTRDESQAPTLRDRARAFARDALRHVGASIEDVTRGKIADLRSAIDRSGLDDTKRTEFENRLTVYEADYDRCSLNLDTAISARNSLDISYYRGRLESVFRNLNSLGEQLASEGVDVPGLKRPSLREIYKNARTRITELRTSLSDLFDRAKQSAVSVALGAEIAKLDIKISRLEAEMAAKEGTTGGEGAIERISKRRDALLRLRDSLDYYDSKARAGTLSQKEYDALVKHFALEADGANFKLNDASGYHRAVKDLDESLVSKPGSYALVDTAVVKPSAKSSEATETEAFTLTPDELSDIADNQVLTRNGVRLGLGSRDLVVRMRTLRTRDGRELTVDEVAAVWDHLLETNKIPSDRLDVNSSWTRVFRAHSTAAKDIISGTLAGAAHVTDQPTARSLFSFLNSGHYNSVFDAITTRGNFSEVIQSRLLAYFYGGKNLRTVLIDGAVGLRFSGVDVSGVFVSALKDAYKLSTKKPEKIEPQIVVAENGFYGRNPLNEGWRRAIVGFGYRTPTGESISPKTAGQWAGYAIKRAAFIALFIYPGWGRNLIQDQTYGRAERYLETRKIEQAQKPEARAEIIARKLGFTKPNFFDFVTGIEDERVRNEFVKAIEDLMEQESAPILTYPITKDILKPFSNEKVPTSDEKVPIYNVTTGIPELKVATLYLKLLQVQLLPYPSGGPRSLSDYAETLNAETSSKVAATYSLRFQRATAIISLDALGSKLYGQADPKRFIVDDFLQTQHRSADELVKLLTKLNGLSEEVQRKALARGSYQKVVEFIDAELSIKEAKTSGVLAKEMEHQALAATIIHFVPKLAGVDTKVFLDRVVAEFERCEKIDGFVQLRSELQTESGIRKMFDDYKKAPYVSGMSVDDSTAWQMEFITNMIKVYKPESNISMYAWIILNGKGASIDLTAITSLSKEQQDKFAPWLYLQFEDLGMLDSDGGTEPDRVILLRTYLEKNPSAPNQLTTGSKIPDLITAKETTD